MHFRLRQKDTQITIEKIPSHLNMHKHLAMKKKEGKEGRKKKLSRSLIANISGEFFRTRKIPSIASTKTQQKRNPVLIPTDSFPMFFFFVITARDGKDMRGEKQPRE